MPQLPHYHISRALGRGLLLVIVEILATLLCQILTGGRRNRSFSRLASVACCFLLLKAIFHTLLSLIKVL